MNLLFFLLPKSELTYVRDDFTLAKTLELMEGQGFSAIPMINKKGHYVGTLTEGDILWALKNTPGISFENAAKIKLNKVPRKKTVHPVNVNAKVEELVAMAMTQNFVPVIDDAEIFIGIITRRDIIKYCTDEITKHKQAKSKRAEAKKTAAPAAEEA